MLTKMVHGAMRLMVKNILERAFDYSWTLQGLGMLRMRLSDEYRLHVWHLGYAFPGASPIHDHIQWGLESFIIAGKMRNIRFTEIDPKDGVSWRDRRFMHQKILAGEGGGPIEEPSPIWLRQQPTETYPAGTFYWQTNREIHWSIPEDGTVTIMRKLPAEDGTSARVFWEWGTEWGTAEPRPATEEEIRGMTGTALSKWFL